MFGTVHRYSVQEEPKKQKKTQATSKKTLNPKRVRTGWSRGGSLALARRAAHDLLGRGAALPGGNPYTLKPKPYTLNPGSKPLKP